MFRRYRTLTIISTWLWFDNVDPSCQRTRCLVRCSCFNFEDNTVPDKLFIEGENLSIRWSSSMNFVRGVLTSSRKIEVNSWCLFKVLCRIVINEILRPIFLKNQNQVSMSIVSWRGEQKGDIVNSKLTEQKILANSKRAPAYWLFWNMFELLWQVVWVSG